MSATKRQELKSLKGMVSQIKFRDDASGFTVFQLIPFKEKSLRVSCAGVLDKAPEVQEALEVFGYFDTKSKYKGINFKLTAVVPSMGESVYHLSRYLVTVAKFLGDDKAARIAKHFGKNLERLINEEPDRLLEVDGIGAQLQ